MPYTDAKDATTIYIPVGAVAANTNGLSIVARVPVQAGKGEIVGADMFIDAGAGIVGLNSDHPTWTLQKSADGSSWTNVGTLDFITGVNSSVNVPKAFTINSTNGNATVNVGDFVRAMVNVTLNTLAVNAKTACYVYVAGVPDYASY